MAHLFAAPARGEPGLNQPCRFPSRCELSVDRVPPVDRMDATAGLLGPSSICIPRTGPRRRGSGAPGKPHQLRNARWTVGFLPKNRRPMAMDVRSNRVPATAGSEFGPATPHKERCQPCRPVNRIGPSYLRGCLAPPRPLFATGTGGASMSTYRLEKLFCPRSVAVVGARPRERSVGRVVIRNLRAGGFSGSASRSTRRSRISAWSCWR